MSADKKKTPSIFERISELAGLNNVDTKPPVVSSANPMVNQTVTMHPVTQVPPTYMTDQFALMRALMVEQAMAHSAYAPLMLAAASGLPFLPVFPNAAAPFLASNPGKTKCTTMTIEDTKIHSNETPKASYKFGQSTAAVSKEKSLNCSLSSDASTSSTSSTGTGITSVAGPVASTPGGRQAPRFQCPDCSRSYSTFSGLSKHRQFHCSSQLKRQFACKFCNKQYSSLGALKMHIRTHTLPCKCTVCGKAFSRPWLLQGHLRTHTGEKPFRCGHCGRAFADRSNLRAHLQTHSEVKKYKCKACMKTFSRMSLLNKHETNGCNGAQSGDAKQGTD